mmetsp:Transcript_17993/g.51285  ORF Transcript_17993/g.51285 Transcript_17993/m.51285 type:complete len:274 (-) Transcript_17993:913-1734(-)
MSMLLDASVKSSSIAWILQFLLPLLQQLKQIFWGLSDEKSGTSSPNNRAGSGFGGASESGGAPKPSCSTCRSAMVLSFHLYWSRRACCFFAAISEFFIKTLTADIRGRSSPKIFSLLSVSTMPSDTAYSSIDASLLSWSRWLFMSVSTLSNFLVWSVSATAALRASFRARPFGRNKGPSPPRDCWRGSRRGCSSPSYNALPGSGGRACGEGMRAGASEPVDVCSASKDGMYFFFRSTEWRTGSWIGSAGSSSDARANSLCSDKDDDVDGLSTS